MKTITKESIISALTMSNQEPDFSVAPLKTVLRHFNSGLDSVSYGENGSIEFNYSDGTTKSIDTGILIIDLLASNGTDLPLDSLANGVLRRYYFPSVALIERTVEKAAKDVKTAILTPKQTLMNDIRASFKAQHDALISTAKNLMQTPSKITTDLLDSYYGLVEDGKDLLIDGLPISTGDTVAAIGKEKLQETITNAENCFSGIADISVTVEPDSSFKKLDVLVQHFNEADKEAIDAKLKEQFKSVKWNIIPTLKTAIINITIA